MRAWLLALTLLMAAPRIANADCACLPKVSPSSGVVPVRGSLYLGSVYLLERFEVSVKWIGTPGTATWTVQDGVARLDYSGSDGAELVVVMFKEHEHGRYKLDADWRAPATPPHAIRFDHHESSWRCASTDALFIDLDQSTAAVRVRWTHSGTTTTRVLATDGRVELGQVSCCGETLSPEELHDGGTLELVAIRTDGSEAPILGVPRFVYADMYSSETTVAGSLRAVMRPAAARGAPLGRSSSDELFVPEWLRFVLSLGLISLLVYISRLILGRIA